MTSSTRLFLCAGIAGCLLGWTVAGQQQPDPPRFRTGTNLIRVDVTVRDRDGQPVRNLTASDFELLEDGKRQSIVSFGFQEIPLDRGPQEVPPAGNDALPDLAALASPSPQRDQVPVERMAGKRIIVMLFDTSAMPPEEVTRAADAALDWVDEEMAAADVVAIAALGQTLQLLAEFTSDREVLSDALRRLNGTEGAGVGQPEAADAGAEEAEDPAEIPLDDTEFGIFNNDRRLKAMTVLCNALSYIESKKALLYFSSGMSRGGTDNQVELRNLTSAANRANVAIFPMDSRGLMAVVPGGDASRASRGGRAAFSGRGMMNQFTQLYASQETLTTLAADTGGQAFLESNDFSRVFTAAQAAVSTYYLLGYNSANTARDGKFRRIAVRVKVPGASVDARKGYYADIDFAHLSKEGRERQLQDQVAAAVPVTDLPVAVATSWFRLERNRFYVPLAIAVPGSAVTLPATGAKEYGVDLLGVMVDEQGRAVGRIRDTMRIPADTDAELSRKHLQYQGGVTLPAGRFIVKVAVRENSDGTLGAFQFPIAIPDLDTVEAGLKVSPVVFSTQLRPVAGGRGLPSSGSRPLRSQLGGRDRLLGALNPLVADGQEIVQSLTHVVNRDGVMYFYYEVYEPPLDRDGEPRLRTMLGFYRGSVKVFETPVVYKRAIDATQRTAVVFQFAVPAATLPAGLYTCQITVIDEVSGQMSFQRLALYAR